jgi:hypothetical protein
VNFIFRKKIPKLIRQTLSNARNFFAKDFYLRKISCNLCNGEREGNCKRGKVELGR